MSASLTRRAALAAPLALSPLLSRPARAAPRPVVTVFGDSITSGYGLPPAQALPAQLGRELAALGVEATVRAAGFAGATTETALRRVDDVARQSADVCVVAFGGNDLLNLVEPARIRANLGAVVERLKSRRVKVVLAGMQAPPELGAYARAYNAVFPTVARAQAVTLHPALLAGVMLDRRYNQSDLIHPNAAGVRIIARRLAPTVAAALKAGTLAAR
jgi:acyl-CoA thioesterase-1